MANIKSFPNNQDEYIGAQDVMRWLHGRTSGVFGAENNAAVAPVLDTMFVTVSDGNGWMSNDNGDGIVWWINNEEVDGSKLTLSVDMADAVLPRIDRVVVSWNTTTYVDLPEVIILKGTPATYPAAPELTNNHLVRQISLAAILVPAGSTTINALNITDERLNPDVCGIVTERIGVDTSMVHEQYLSAVDELRSAIRQMWSGVIPDGSITQNMLDPNIKLGSNDIYVGADEPTGEERPKLWINPDENRGVAKRFTAVFKADGWSASAPYTQTVTVSGILSTDEPLIDVYLADVEDGTAIIDAWGCVGRVTASANDKLTAYCYEEKPAVDIPVLLKVV